MAERIIQRVVFPIGDRPAALYYRSTESVANVDRFSVHLRSGSRLSADTYFNTFFENYWHLHTTVRKVSLHLEVEGTGTVRLLRRTGGQTIAVAAKSFSCPGERIALDLPTACVRDAGLVHFDLTAGSEGVYLHRAEWVAEDVEAETIRLVVGCCTFDREAALFATLRSLFADIGLNECLSRVVVVDQGQRSALVYRGYDEIFALSGGRLEIAKQANFGGAGGFARAIIETRRDPLTTHVLLMDDDIVLEPESVFRAVALLSLASAPLGVGAPMLDLAHPTEMCESGGRIDTSKLCTSVPVPPSRNIDSTDRLERLREPQRVDYNGWWFFAFPLNASVRVGLPLPLFLRGDDAEFGLRLGTSGVPTVTLPGIGVWHESFHNRGSGWQPYYDLRNMLILSAVHSPISACRAGWLVFARVVSRLLRLDYREADLLCAAADDYCLGPALLEATPPWEIHARIMTRYREASMILNECGNHPASSRVPIRPRILAFAWCVLRQFLLPSPSINAVPDTIAVRTNWEAMSRADVVALTIANSSHTLILRRSRPHFLALCGRAMRSALRLARAHRRVGRDWRTAFPRLTSEDFWNRYLGLRESVSDRCRAAA